MSLKSEIPTDLVALIVVLSVDATTTSERLAISKRVFAALVVARVRSFVL